MDSLNPRVALLGRGVLLLLAAIACSEGDKDATWSVAFEESPEDTTLPGEARDVRVRVTNAAGRGVGGAHVTFAPLEGTGQVTQESVFSDDSGLARTAWALGPEDGVQQTIEARISPRVAAILAVNVAPLALSAGDFSLESVCGALAQDPCYGDEAVFQISAPACSQALSELKLELTGLISRSGMSSVSVDFSCGNVAGKFELSPFSSNDETIFTLVWSNRSGPVLMVDEFGTGQREPRPFFASEYVEAHPNVLPSYVAVRAAGTGLGGGFALADVTKLVMWAD